MTVLDTPPSLPTWAPGEESAALGNAWMSYIYSLASPVSALNGEVDVGKLAAQASQTSAAASLAFVNKLAAATKWISGTSYAVNDSVWSPADFQTYYRLIAGAGTTDPSADATNWALWSLKAAGGTFSALGVINGLTADSLATDKLAANGPIRERYAEVDGVVINCALGNWFGKAVTGAITLSLTGVPTTPKVYAFTLELSRPGTNITWWSGITWKQGEAPTDLSATGRALLGFLTVDGGTTWSGFVLANNLPEIFWLNCLNAEALDSRISLSRSSNGSYYDSTGTLQTAGTNVARKDFDPTTLAAKGWLIEENRTNLFLRSQEFDNASWSKSTCTVTANAVAAPDGTSTADKLVESAATGRHYVGQDVTITAGAYTAVSVFVKAGERTKVGFTYGMSGSPFTRMGMTLDTATGAVGVQNSGSPLVVLFRSAQQLPNGWWRISMAGQFDLTSTSGHTEIYPLDASGNQSYTGDGTSGLYVWGAQVEAGEFVTSYIPTTTATVTRSADIPSVTGTSFSNWYNQSAGAFYVEADAITNGLTSANANAFPFLLDCDDGTANANTSHQILASAGYGPGLNFVVADGVAAKNQIQTTALPSALIKACLAYSQSNSRGAINGTLSTALAALASPPLTMSRLSIGCQNASAGNAWSGHIRKLRYYPRRIEDSCLQGLTA